jgi:DNA-binding transcriptional MerR regulator
LYSSHDVRRVERILALLDEGHSLPAIARELKAGDRSALNRERLAGQAGVWAGYVGGSLQAIADFSTERLEAIFNEATSLHPLEMVTERLIEPILVELGERWQTRDAGIAEEHFYSAWVRNRLGARFHHAIGQAHGPRILCAGLPGGRHDIGLLLFSLSALSRGYRTLYLGADLPLAQVPLVVERSAARGVVMSSRSDIEAPMHAELADLSRSLDIPLMLGGPCSDQPLADFEDAGGVRLGSRIPVALKVLGSRVPLYAATSGAAAGKRGGR